MSFREVFIEEILRSSEVAPNSEMFKKAFELDGEVSFGNQRDRFDSLPDDIYLQILQMLPASRDTGNEYAAECKRWAQIIRENVVWPHLCFSNEEMCLEAIEKILRSGIRKLYILYCKISEPTMQSQIEVDVFNLREIWLCETNITPHALYTLIRSCPRLEALRLKVHVSLDVQLCEAIGKCELLTELELIHAPWMPSQGIKAIGQGCPRLQDLNLFGTELTSCGFKAMAGFLPEGIRSLNIWGNEALTDLDFEMIMAKCPNLTCLDVHSSKFLTGKAMVAICKLDNLIYLTVNGCKNIPFEAFGCLANARNLKRVFLQDNGLYQAQEVAALKELLQGVEIRGI